MGEKLPVISVSKLIEVLKCPRCVWLMVHRGVKSKSDHSGWRSRDKHLIRRRYDRARRTPRISKELVGWSRPRCLPRAILLTTQKEADHFRYRLQYLDADCGFIVRGQVDDALWDLRTQAYLPIKISFPESMDREVGRLKQARLDELVRLFKECGFRTLGRAVVAEYLSAPGSKSGMAGWQCLVRAIPTSSRRSNRLHRAMKRILARERPPRASEECGAHCVAREEALLARMRR
jgi:hypothetical protein